MSTMKRLILFLLLWTPMIHAESWDSLVERAFGAMEQDLSAHWAFTETAQNTDGTYVAHCDPRRSERWELVSVDGRDPTVDEIEEFLEEKDRDREAKENSKGNGLHSLVATGSLELIEETGVHWLFAFKPKTDTDDEAKFMAFVDGTLKVVKDGHYVALIEMHNNGTIKPGKGVKLTKFETRLEFAQALANEPIVPVRVSTAVQGKAMLVIKFDEQGLITYSDFKRIAEEER